jgi:2-deoxy-D-gluconate 3-dehydrogenase
MTPSVSITGKVILITGGAGQIGRTLCEGFLKQGALVAISDWNTEALQASEREMLSTFAPAGFMALHHNITQEDSNANCIARVVENFGKLDVLINNAAIDAKFVDASDKSVNQSRFEHYPAALLRRSVEVNLTGTVLMTQAACRQMLIQQSGNIINVASTYSVVSPNQSLYDYGDGNIRYKPIDYIASKSFIPNFTRYIATFYAKEGIRCNAIVPHGIYNNHPRSFLDNWNRLSPMGRMCRAEELIGPFTFLASDASSYMTGSTLTIDGGWTAW